MKLFHTPRGQGPFANGVEEIDSSFVEYVFSSLPYEHGFLVLSGQGKMHPGDMFNTLPEDAVIIFDECTNPIDDFSALDRDDFDIIERPCIILTSTFNSTKKHNFPKNVTVKFFPFWEVWTAQQSYQLSKIPKKYKISCLMGTEWNHRKLMYLALSKQSWFDSMVFSYGNREYYDDWKNTLSKNEQTEFNKLLRPCQYLVNDSSHEIDLTIQHPAYADSWINLIVETSVDSSAPILSEKTFKPIASGQLFVTFSAPGSIEYLRSQGYDVFDDIIDHNYDNEQDVRKRRDMIISELNQLVQLDLNSIGSDLESRFKTNRNILVKSIQRNTCLINKQVV